MITVLAIAGAAILPLGAETPAPAYGPHPAVYPTEARAEAASLEAAEEMQADGASEDAAPTSTNGPAAPEPDVRAVSPTNTAATNAPAAPAGESATDETQRPRPGRPQAPPNVSDTLRETAKESPTAAPASTPVAPHDPSARRRRPPSEASRRMLPGAPPVGLPPLPPATNRGATNTSAQPPLPGYNTVPGTNLPALLNPGTTNTPGANPADLQMRPEPGRPSVPAVTDTNAPASPGITPSSVPGRNVGPVAVPPGASAEQINIPPTPRDDEGTPLPLSLRQCILLALRSNLDIGIERLNPEVARANVMTERGAFDPRLSASYTHGEDTSAFFAPTVTGEEQRQSTSRRDNYEVAMTQRTATGATVTANTTTGRGESAPSERDDTFNSYAGLSLVQPLLRGFGTDVNLGSLRIARRNQRVADATFYDQVQQVVRDVCAAYFELIYIRRDLQTRLESLELAEQLLRDNAARVEIGTMSPIDISQASAEAAARREELYRVQRSIRDQENVLKRLITNDIMPWLKFRIIPTDIPPDAFTPVPLQRSITLAMRNRMDLKRGLEQAEIANIQVRQDENGMLPQVDFRADYGYGGLSRHYGPSVGNIAQTDNPQWQVGVTVEIPLGNREARGRLMASNASRQQTLMELKRLEQNIIVEVDNAAGRAASNQQRIVSAAVARKLAEETLRDEQLKLNEGASTSFVVLQLQQDLTAARLRELRAIADMQIAVVDLVRAQGVILQRNNLFIDNAPPIRRGVAARDEAPVPPLNADVPVARPLDPPRAGAIPTAKPVSAPQGKGSARTRGATSSSHSRKQ